MLLGALLVPFTIIGSSTVDARIEQLKNDLQEKQLELSDIEEMIAEKEEQIDAMTKRGAKLVRSISWDDEKKEQQFRQELISFDSEVRLSMSAKNDMQGFLAKELLRDHKTDREEFKRLKFVVIRIAVEYGALEKLLNGYEQCLQQVHAIEVELENLQKQVSLM